MKALDRFETAGRILVVDIGGTNVKFGYSVAGLPQQYVRLFPTEELRNDDPIDSFVFMIRKVVKEASIVPDLIISSVPGFLDIDEDRVLFAGNLHQLNGLKLASELTARTGIPVILDRDSILALLGEMFAGAGQGCRSALGVFFGTGVGAAFVEDGRPFRGAGWALEIGHIPFRSERRSIDGVQRDSLERYVSGRVLEEIAARHNIPVTRVFAASASSNDLADELSMFLCDQAFAIGIAATLFSPEAIIVGGGVCAMDSFPRERLSSLVEAHGAFAQTGRKMNLRWAQLGWQSTLHGAHLAAIERLRRHA